MEIVVIIKNRELKHKDSSELCQRIHGIASCDYWQTHKACVFMMTCYHGEVVKTECFYFWSNVSHVLVCRGLADTKHTGKLNREQFSLAMHLIQQKSTRGVDPPLTLTPDMIPPSERTAAAVGLPVSACSRCLLMKLPCLLCFFSPSKANQAKTFLWCILPPKGRTHRQRKSDWYFFALVLSFRCMT